MTVRHQEQTTIGAAGETRQLTGAMTATGDIGGASLQSGAGNFPGSVTADGFVQRIQALAQAAAIDINCALGTIIVVTFLTNAIFTINAPTNPVAGMRMSITFKNTSGGALGAATWNAVFKRVTAITPANNLQMTVDFYYDGVNWIETNTSANNVPV